MYKKLFGDTPGWFIVVMIVFAIAMSYSGYWELSHTAYQGKMMVNHDQYEVFKASAVNPEFDISRLQVMNSEPVYLDFNVIVPRSANFPLGERIDWQYNLLGVLVSLSGLFLVSLPLWAWRMTSFTTAK